MDRTVPHMSNDNINLYLRTYYSLLRSTREIPVDSLSQIHIRSQSALHRHADSHDIDMDAFTYGFLRLPRCITQTRMVLMGQSAHVFATHGYPDIEQWERVNAPARRRSTHFDGNRTIGVYIASRSDIDDLVPLLVTYQIEVRKLRKKLNNDGVQEYLIDMKPESGLATNKSFTDRITSLTGISEEQIERFHVLLGDDLIDYFLEVRTANLDFHVRLLAGSMVDYGRAIRCWWQDVENQIVAQDHRSRPIHFVSSNTHAIANMLSGFALKYRDDIEKHLLSSGQNDLISVYSERKAAHDLSANNILYYQLKKFERSNPKAVQERIALEEKQGIQRINIPGTFDVEVQIIDVQKIDFDVADPRLRSGLINTLRESDALIINIDYPLGMAARLILAEIAETSEVVRSVTSIGKAATLNARVGDIMLPNVVHDEHSQNTFLIRNCFSAEDVAPFLPEAAVLDNQKAITVLSTILQNQNYMSVMYNEGFTDMEMEAGPYLSTIYEMTRPKRHPVDEIVDLHDAPFDVGFLHYASDTPLHEGANLGSGSLSFAGVDSTYAVALAALTKIFDRCKRA